jgi:excisionase family DNA binding protein
LPTSTLEKVAYTITEFSQAFGVGRTKIYDDIKAGTLKTRKAGRRTLIRAEDAKAWLDALPEACDAGY